MTHKYTSMNDYLLQLPYLNEESGECLISDFTANDVCEGLWKQALGDMA